jgi:hypothetical protein
VIPASQTVLACGSQVSVTLHPVSTNKTIAKNSPILINISPRLPEFYLEFKPL